MSSSKNPNWRTPRWLFDALNEEFSFGLDAAADSTCTLCDQWLGPGGVLDDALSGVSWAHIHESIFLNPPYSVKLFQETADPAMHIANWLPPIVGAVEDGATVVAILPYSVQTRWWRKYVEGDLFRATEIRKFPFRLKFEPPPDYTGKATGSNVNSAAVVWRPSKHFLDPWVPLVRYYDPRPNERRTDEEEDNGTD